MAVKEWVEFFLVFNQYLERAGPSIWWFWKVMNAYNEEYDVITMKNNFCYKTEFNSFGIVIQGN